MAKKALAAVAEETKVETKENTPNAARLKELTKAIKEMSDEELGIHYKAVQDRYAKLNAARIAAEHKKRQEEYEAEEKKRQEEQEVNDAKREELLAKYRTEWKALVAEGKKLAKKVTMEISIPVTLTMIPEAAFMENSNLQDLIDYEEEGDELLTRVFNPEFKGTLGKNSVYSREDRKIINKAIENYVDDACEQIRLLVPPELMAPYKAFAEKVQEFGDKCKEVGEGQDQIDASELLD